MSRRSGSRWRVRKWALGGVYRYGFNGKENDNEVKGEGNQIDYGMRVYDPRIGKFLSVDPLTKSYPHYTPYQFAGNTPIQAIDLDGNEELHYTMTLNKDGSTTLKLTDIKFFYKQDLFSKIMGVFDLRSNADKLRIPERAVVHYTNTNKDYYIGFSGSKGRGNENGMGLFKSIRRNMDADFFVGNFLNEDQSNSVESFSMAVHMQDNTALYGPLTEKAWFTEQFRPGARKRLEAFLKYSPTWNKGSLREALTRFVPGVSGVLSADGVKTKYVNPETNIEVMVDNENNYFRIYDHNKKQELLLDGKLPSTGKLKGQEAKDHVKASTHYVNTDK